ncbi:MAG: DUF4926 domain-containing protein [Deltaproteobacteria bacterium]|nr:DUF4926 domain-containing protein [Deltaproteobacteria bacterium]
MLSVDLPEEQLMAGDIGAIVEHHPETATYPEG